MRSFLLLLLFVSPLHAEWQNLWPAEAPGAKRPPAGTETLKEGGRINSVEVPQYFLYQPNAKKIMDPVPVTTLLAKIPLRNFSKNSPPKRPFGRLA